MSVPVVKWPLTEANSNPEGSPALRLSQGSPGPREPMCRMVSLQWETPTSACQGVCPALAKAGRGSAEGLGGQKGEGQNDVILLTSGAGPFLAVGAEPRAVGCSAVSLGPAQQMPEQLQASRDHHDVSTMAKCPLVAPALG